MLVVNIIDGVPSIQNVPDNYLRCSVSGEFRPVEEFETNGVRSRTNCERTFKMPYEEMQALTAQTKQQMQSIGFKKLLNKLTTQITFRDNSIAVKDLIAQLQELPDNARIVITQEGYYADGQLAEIHEPDIVRKTESELYYSIGHSAQNY